MNNSEVSLPHSVSFAVQELLRKHAAGELEMASGPRCMTSAEQSEVLDTLIGTLEQLEALRGALRSQMMGGFDPAYGEPPWYVIAREALADSNPASEREDSNLE